MHHSAAIMLILNVNSGLNAEVGGSKSSDTSRDNLASGIRRKMDHSWSDEVQAVVCHHM